MSYVFFRFTSINSQQVTIFLTIYTSSMVLLLIFPITMWTHRTIVLLYVCTTVNRIPSETYIHLLLTNSIQTLIGFFDNVSFLKLFSSITWYKVETFIHCQICIKLEKNVIKTKSLNKVKIIPNLNMAATI